MRRSPSAANGPTTKRAPAPAPSPSRKNAKELKDEAALITPQTMNEQVVIAAALVSPEERAKLVRAVSADAFYAQGHPAAWRAIAELDRLGLTYDPATVHQLSNGEANTKYLDDLVRSRPKAPPNLWAHVRWLKWDRRRIEAGRGVVSEFMEALLDATSEPVDVKRRAEAVARAFEGEGELRFLREPKSVLAEIERDLDESAERARRGQAVAFPYGLPGLDVYENGEPRIIPGAAPAGITLLVGQSGHGKTTLVNQMVLAQVAMGRRVLHGAWEQKANVNGRLLVGFSLGLDRARVASGRLTDEERVCVREEASRLIGGERPPIRFFELPFDQTRGNRERNVRILNETNLDIIHEHVELSGCDVAVFDLFHQALVETKPDDEKRALDRMQAIGKATRAHLVIVHHLNKADLAARPDQRPTRAAIKGGTHWINAPDTIIAPHIPGKVKDIPMNTLEAHVLKQRDGEWPIAVEFDYDPRTGIVTNGRSMSYEFESRPDAREDTLGIYDDSRGKRGRGGR